MKIDASILAEWQKLSHNGDQRRLAEIAGVSTRTIQKALAGKASPETFVAIQKFYQERRRLLNQEGAC